MNLFIDTNIYLNFYHYTSEDLEELKKLAVAIENREIKLYSTEQVIDEFKRNRESKIADALKKFHDQKLNTKFPQICKEYEEFKSLKKLCKKYADAKDKLVQKLNIDIANRTLGADKIIDDLFDKAEILHSKKKILSAAKTRVDLGNPPGKDGSYGDAINWEVLIAGAPNEDIYLITDDKDYISPIDENKLSEFLLEEWRKKKQSEIFFYRRLSEFFRDKFPLIKLASELEKELAISSLISSGKFQDTHLAIARLSKFTDFSDKQINEIVTAAVFNSQIYWIKDDPDVKEFLESVIRGKELIIDPTMLKIYNIKYKSKETETGEQVEVNDIPF